MHRRHKIGGGGYGGGAGGGEGDHVCLVAAPYLVSAKPFDFCFCSQFFPCQ